MPKKLVIVESPAKAKTIQQFLGSDYVVEASIGHIRDLPENKKALPEALRKKWWADYAVDVDADFQPFYVVPPEKKKVVEKLKERLKGAEELILATDEDREGESISWHLLQALKPGPNVRVKRIAFHEITRKAIHEALEKPREIDRKLVEAQETRRILDRLYGYTLSPVLWSRITKDQSAGRVQSPAVKLIVERAKRRRDFVRATYWGLRATYVARGQTFTANLSTLGGRPIATGADFDENTGKPKNDRVIVLDAQTAAHLKEASLRTRPWTVSSVDRKPGKEPPPPPFRTTTLQQEANRKFGFSAERTMRIAQDLYEGIDLNGARAGLITYMRTDSLNLADEAVAQARQIIASQYGKDHVPDRPNRYASKVANAQEAHEAVRPTDFQRSPESIRAALISVSEAHFKLYDLIYRRTLACQMKPAEVVRASVEVTGEIEGQTAEFRAAGKEIVFPGFLLAYVEDVDDADAELESRERVLPELNEGDQLQLSDMEALSKETRPPPRYTDASLIKALEDLGIGRPSTYASIISVIEDRGYVKKERRELIATWKAFLAMEVLEKHFQEFMDLKFTAAMDAELDDIANGKDDPKAYLKRFFLGNGGVVGLKTAVQERKASIPFPAIEICRHPETGESIYVRLSKDERPFLQLGDAENRVFASMPDDVYPEDLNCQKALELFSQGEKEPVVVGTHAPTGRRLLLRRRNGYYLEVERTKEEIEAKVRPTWISLPAGVDPQSLSQEDLDYLSSLPRVIGRRPDSGEEIVFRIGKYGPYIQCGSEMRSVSDWRAGATMSVEECLALLAMPKGAASRSASRAMTPIKDFGALQGADGPVKVMPGRYGPYVTDGKTNATIPKGTDPASLTPEQALELIAKRREAGPAKKGKRFQRPFRGRAKKR